MPKKNKTTRDRQNTAAIVPATAEKHVQQAMENLSAPQRKQKFATAAEAAEFLHLSKASIHNGINRGEIHARRYGTAVRIPWAWLESQAQTEMSAA
jgi:Helix-turn-helix domain